MPTNKDTNDNEIHSVGKLNEKKKEKEKNRNGNSGSVGRSKKTNYLFSDDLMHFDDLLYLFILSVTRYIYIVFFLISLVYSTRIRTNLELKHFYKHELQINFIIIIIIESCKLCNILLLLLLLCDLLRIWMIILCVLMRTHCDSQRNAVFIESIDFRTMHSKSKEK